jgi:short-subunit dehydrogenase
MPLPFKKDTYALVTGGSSGIGLAFVHQLADKGYNICIVSNQKEKLLVLENEIETKQKVKCTTLFIDLAEDDAAQKVYSFCKNNKLIIEVLINNAGFLIADNFINVAPQRISALLKLHILTTTLLCQFMAKDMIARRKGYILNVSSTSAYMPYPLISLYGPSKTYIRNFTKAIRNELYDKNIYVSCILPGAVDTNLYHLSTSKKKIAKKLGVMHNAQFVAKRGLQALFKNKGELVIGLLNKLSLIFLKLVPDFVIRKILHSRNHSKLKKKENNIQ